MVVGRGGLGSRCGGVDVAGRTNDDAVKRVGHVLDLVDGVPVMRLEADLSAICPRAFHPGIVGEGAEDGMVGRR